LHVTLTELFGKTVVFFFNPEQFTNLSIPGRELPKILFVFYTRYLKAKHQIKIFKLPMKHKF